MIRRRGKRTAGSALLEFTLVGIPMIFVLISSVEMSRGMWMYHTLSYAVKEGTRYASVHGQNCTIPPNNCGVSISQLATKIQTTGVGLPADSVTLKFTTDSGAVTTCTMSDCIANYTGSNWPPSTANAPGLKVKITGIYTFRSAISMFWPGAGRATGASGVINLSADSLESIQF